MHYENVSKGRSGVSRSLTNGAAGVDGLRRRALRRGLAQQAAEDAMSYVKRT